MSPKPTPKDMVGLDLRRIVLQESLYNKQQVENANYY